MAIQLLRDIAGHCQPAAVASRRRIPTISVNDTHSQLNSTRVDRIVAIDSEATLRATIATARAEGKPVCVAGGRHAMGGQQFATGAVLIDTRSMNRIVALDAERGIVEAEAGIQWPELVGGLIKMQEGSASPSSSHWGIIQKQTGAVRLTLGGALAANVHGRGLALKPIIGDVLSFTLMDADGNLRNCSRSENSDLFRLVIGGYGLFGVVTRVRLKLMRRTKVERVAQIIDTDELMPAFAQRIADGFLYGDCQFSTDMSSDTYLRKGVFASYRPLPPDAPIPAEQKDERSGVARALYLCADTRAAYDACVLLPSTSGQRYWSDTNQLSLYIDGYHAELSQLRPHKCFGGDHRAYVPLTCPEFAATRRLPPTRQLSTDHPPVERDDEIPRLGARALGLHRHEPARRTHGGRRPQGSG